MTIQGAMVADPAMPRAGLDERGWNAIIDSLPVAVCICDLDGRVTRYNERAAGLWGRLPGWARGQDFGKLELLPPGGELPVESGSPLSQLADTGRPVRDRELLIERTDGTRIFVKASFEPLLDAKGAVTGGVGFFHDISAAKEAERLLQQIMRALPVAVYTTDAEGRITFFNEAAAALWGHRPELGSDHWCGSWRLRTPDGEPLPHDQCPMAVALREDREIQWGRAVAERPDGTLVPFLAFPTPLHDAGGRLTGAVNTLLDLSAQPLASEAGMQLAAIVESSMDAIVSKDINGIITSWNKAAEQLFGYLAEEAIGQPVTMLLPDGQMGEEVSIIQRIRAGERVETYETIRRHKDGHAIPVSLTVSPVRDARGRIVGASKIARDITGHKENERRIRLLMREVNHRVKNQYSVILSIIRETSRRWQDPVQFERHVRERIMALSDSHDLLVLADWKGATTYELLRAQVTPFADSDRLSFSGPPVLLNPNAVQYLGIAFHELATNAAKYGALSNKTGHISVDWQIVLEPDGSKAFELAWRELGGPPASKASGAGFGTVVLLRVAPQAMSASGDVVYGDGGLIWRFRAPLSTIEATDKDV
jgi:PAS domain S-box-containing protein